MPSTRVQTALIVGGGVGGMSAALRLRQAGVSVHLIDIDPKWKPLGAGLTLNGATLRAFHRLGLLDKIEACGHIHGGRRILTPEGQIVFDAPGYRPERGDQTAGGGILRPVLHEILSTAVRQSGVTVNLGFTVSSLTQRDNRVAVIFSNSDEAVYDLVIGADGLMSTVRKMIMPDAPAPEFTGQGCWRAVFPRPAANNTIWIFMDEAHKIGLNPVSDAEMYMFLLESAPGNPWRAPSNWQAELAARLAPFGGFLEDLANNLNCESRINYRPLEFLLLPPPWHVGRVVLLGDACHATTPHAGYGAGLAIEDGLVLGDCLDLYGSVEAALGRYAERRFKRCHAVIERSLELGRLEMARAPIAEQVAASVALADIVAQPLG